MTYYRWNSFFLRHFIFIVRTENQNSGITLVLLVTKHALITFCNNFFLFLKQWCEELISICQKKKILLYTETRSLHRIIPREKNKKKRKQWFDTKKTNGVRTWRRIRGSVCWGSAGGGRAGHRRGRTASRNRAT